MSRPVGKSRMDGCTNELTTKLGRSILCFIKFSAIVSDRVV
jgi:hypothetical protein